MNTSTHKVSFITLVLGLVLFTGRTQAQSALYWTDPYAGMIQRMDVDSGTIDTLLAATLQFPHALAVDLNAGKLYWISMGKDQIQRANLDGTDIEDLPLNVGGIIGLALDADGGKLYWWSYGDQGIRRANLDGTEIEVLTLVDEGADDLVLDPENGKMYWSGWGPATESSSIRRANLDGTEIETLVDEGTENLVLDPQNGKMYWTGSERVTERSYIHFIRRANLDGTEIETLVNVNGWPGNLVLDPQNGKMYWSGRDSATESSVIRRANLDGTEIETLIEEPSDFVVVSGGHIVLDEGKMYWQDSNRRDFTGPIGDVRIRRANLDGSGLEDLIVGPPTRPGGLALAGDKLYWINQSLGSIHRADRDGTHEEALITSPVMDPEYLALDMEEGKLYWTESSSKRVRRANLDGSEVETLVHSGSFTHASPFGIALDLNSRHLYWTSWEVGRYPPSDGGTFRANLDGSGVEEISGLQDGGGSAAFHIELDVDAGRMYLSSVSFWTEQAGAATHLQGIILANLDGTDIVELMPPPEFVDPYHPRWEDLFEMALDVEADMLYWSFRSTVGRARLDGTGVEDLRVGLPGYWHAGLVVDPSSDKLYWAANDTSSQMSRSLRRKEGIWDDPSRLSRIMQANLDGSGATTLAQLEGVWVRDITLSPSGTSTSTESTADLPVRHVLGPAYPNPFNPSVTLTYTLAKATHVRLEIFNVLGQKVATLVDAFQAAGRQSVVWDGRKNAGVPMPSGTYLYRLAADDYTVTKVVVRLR